MLGLTLVSPLVAGQIDITATAINPSLLVGEPLVLSVRVRADVPVVVPTDLMSRGLPFRVLIDRGSGYVPYVEYVLSPAPEHEGAGRVPAGITRELVLGYDAAAREWTFPVPGTYRLVAEYEPAAGSPVRSNVATVTVALPTGSEKDVHDRLRQIGPQLVVPHEIGPLEPWIQPLVNEHPQSAYLQGRRLRDLESAMADIGNGYEPGQIPQAGTPDYPPPGPDVRPEIVQARAQDLLPLAVELGGIAGPFQADALLKLGGLYYMAGQPERGREVFERIVREFPDREAARKARGALEDRTSPTLKVAASPATLWPPSQKLEPITVAVMATDDVDPNPSVKLISIVCEDSATQPAAQKGHGQLASQRCDDDDIADAGYGGDDREFRLRAQRVGSGPGRVYTITYGASDAAGNKATATTTVTVAHDQGSAKRK
jgi:hypothetical protein